MCGLQIGKTTRINDLTKKDMLSHHGGHPLYKEVILGHFDPVLSGEMVVLIVESHV